MSRLTKTGDDILNATEGGKKIFEKIIGEIPKKCINSPLREDNNPSFSIFLANNGLWMYKDFSNGNSGTAIQFVQRLNNLTYSEAISYIQELKIDLNKSVEHKKVKENKEITVDWVEMPKMTKKALEYWNSYELSEDFLKQNNVFQAKTIAFNKKIKKYPENALIFIYWAKDIDRVKILNLTPGITKEDKWRNFTPNNYLWFYNDFVKNPCDKLFLSKSVKDSLVLKAIGRCSVAVQNESAKIQIDNNVEKINKIAKEVYVVYGSDAQGKKESKLLTEATGWKHFNTKDKYLRMYDCNDPAELVKVFSLKKLEQELKDKNL